MESTIFVLFPRFSNVITSIALRKTSSGTKDLLPCMATIPRRLDFYNNSDRLPSMSEESQKLFEDFVEKHADSRVIAISHHIEFLIDDILKLELVKAKKEIELIQSTEYQHENL